MMPRLILDRYRVDRPLGEGGEGTVHAAFDSWSGNEVAVKILRPGADRQALAATFALLFRVRHPHIARALDVGTLDAADDALGADAGAPFLVQELARGRDALSWARGRSPEDILFVGAQLAAALATLHALGIRHGDIKPSNILVDDRTGATARLVDFGLSRRGTGGSASGTLGYMAPEVLSGNAGPAADVYALGATLAHLLTGTPPTPGAPPPTPRGAHGELLALFTRTEPPSRPQATAAFALLQRALPEPWAAKAARLRDLTVPGGLFARDACVAAIDAALGNGHGVLRLGGPSGSGKTAVLEEAATRAVMAGYAVPGKVQTAGHGELTVLHTVGVSAHSRPLASAPLKDELATARWQAFAETTEALASAARSRRFALIVDDVPKGSPLDDFASFLERLGKDAPPLVLIIAQQATGAPLPTSCMELAPLTSEQMAAMICTARPLRSSDAAAAEALCHASAGWPGIALALLQQLPGDSLLARAQSGQLEHWASITEASAKQLEALDETSRSMATACALLQPPVPWRVLASLPRLAGLAESARGELERRGLLQVRTRAAGDEVNIAGEALRRWLAEHADATIAGELASHLETYNSAGEYDEDLGRLWHRAGETERASSYLKDAARRAAAALRPIDALQLFEAALDTAAGPEGRASLLLELGRLLLTVGRFDDAAARFAEAGGEDGRMGLAEVRLAEGRHKEAAELLQAPCNDDALQATSEALRARALLLAGAYDDALKAVAQAEARATPHPRGAELQAVCGLVAFYRGELPHARELLSSALGRAQAEGAEHITESCRANLALVLHKAGELAEAEGLYRQALAAARAAHELPRQVLRLSNLATLQQERGQLVEALAAYAEAYELAKVVLGQRELVRVALNWSNLLTWLGEANEAHTRLEEAVQEAARAGMDTEQAYLHLLGSEVALVLGEPQRAEDYLQEAEAAFARANNKAGEIESQAVAAELCLYRRQLTRAYDLGMQAAAAAEASGRQRIAAHALLWATLAAGQGGAEAAAARDAAMRLAKLAETLDDVDLGWLAHAQLAQRDLRAGRQTEAELQLAKAHQLLLAARARVGPTYERGFAAVWYRRELWALAELAPGPKVGTRDFDRLLAINRELAQDHDPDRLLERIIDAAIALSGAQRGFVLLAEADGSLAIRAARNLDARSVPEAELDFSRSIANDVLARGVPVVTIDAMGDERFRDYRSVHHLSLRSVLCLPLRSQAGALGALYLDHRHRVDAFSDADVALLSAFGDQAAIALANARRLNELAASSRELLRSRQEVEELNARLARELEARSAELALVHSSELQMRDGDIGRFGIVGRSAAIREVFRIIERVADKNVPVTIEGESGTGKELVARAIHQASGRQAGPFVSVNCGAIPSELLESELFGHERGAFTGAVRAKPGLFEVARGGTLFLDEVGELPLAMQVKLLRVLQQKEFRRVGGTVDLATDARIISASNRDLAALVRQGELREDLWYRLNVVEVKVPALRARREDLPLLIKHLLARHGGKTPPQLSRRALAVLLDYGWPGNVRELENELQRAIALCDGTITPDDLSARLRGHETTPEPSAGGGLRQTMERFERTTLEAALVANGGKVTQAARALGLTRAGLYKKLHKYGLRVDKS